MFTGLFLIMWYPKFLFQGCNSCSNRLGKSCVALLPIQKEGHTFYSLPSRPKLKPYPCLWMCIVTFSRILAFELILSNTGFCLVKGFIAEKEELLDLFTLNPIMNSYYKHRYVWGLIIQVVTVISFLLPIQYCSSSKCVCPAFKDACLTTLLAIVVLGNDWGM